MYLLVFAVSTVLLYTAGSAHINRVHARLITAIALLLPCVLAGFRAFEIGTDVNVYARPLSELALSHPSFADYYHSKFWALWHTLGPVDYEFGFSLVVWLFARLTGSVSGVLFGIQLLTIVPYYYAVRKYAKGGRIWFAMLVYYLLIFNTSLNMMRQAIALSFVCLGLVCICDKKIGKYLLCMLSAVLFHKTAVLAILVIPIMKLASASTDRRKTVSIVIVLGFMGLLLVQPVTRVLSEMGLTRYAAYLTANKMTIPWSQLFCRCLIVLPLIYASKIGGGLRGYGKRDFAFLLCLVVGLVFTPLGSLSPHASRILLYLDQLAILLIPRVSGLISKREHRRRYEYFSIACMVLYWVVMYGVFGVGHTVPYAAEMV